MADNNLNKKELATLRFIRNRIAHGEGSPSVRDIGVLLEFKWANSAAYVVDKLIERGYLRRRNDGQLQLLRDVPDENTHGRTVNIPLVGTAPCGAPLLATENIEAMIPVSTRLARPPHKYFLVRAEGDSMDQAGIQDGDLVLVMQQPVAENGQRVIALINDEATIKVFQRRGEVITLEPSSSNEKHKPIVLSDDFQVQGIVQTTIPGWSKDKNNG